MDWEHTGHGQTVVECLRNSSSSQLCRSRSNVCFWGSFHAVGCVLGSCVYFLRVGLDSRKKRHVWGCYFRWHFVFVVPAWISLLKAVADECWSSIGTLQEVLHPVFCGSIRNLTKHFIVPYTCGVLLHLCVQDTAHQHVFWTSSWN